MLLFSDTVTGEMFFTWYHRIVRLGLFFKTILQHCQLNTVFQWFGNWRLKLSTYNSYITSVIYSFSQNLKSQRISHPAYESKPRPRPWTKKIYVGSLEAWFLFDSSENDPRFKDLIHWYLKDGRLRSVTFPCYGLKRSRDQKRALIREKDLKNIFL